MKRLGHATLVTPELERQLDYYTQVIGLSLVAKEKGRAVLATKVAQEAIVLEHGKRAAGARLASRWRPEAISAPSPSVSRPKASRASGAAASRRGSATRSC
ncbi:MAG: VOC family protein [Hyphomicrobiales bacterium]|nr:VOC family protein [Hyphomicrobiales bacterium]